MPPVLEAVVYLRSPNQIHHHPQTSSPWRAVLQPVPCSGHRLLMKASSWMRQMTILMKKEALPREER